ncbi:MAG: GNAT family N-acetyltransferase [Weeksellaceae bacterium]|nr:GNAT family N-acetyltransferase [Weeksellaceae bacterium]
MNIKRFEENGKGRFYIEKEGKEAAKIEYTRTDADHITITYTEVDEQMRGEGVGQQLVEKSVEFAREENLKIDPKCSFAKSVLTSSEEFADVLQ